MARYLTSKRGTTGSPKGKKTGAAERRVRVGRG